jgi:hypothetical protein
MKLGDPRVTGMLPVEAVRLLSATDVLRWLGRESTAERGRKFACVWCDSSDGMHAYSKAGGGVHCFSCGRSGSAIDLVMQARGLEFRDAVRWLADRGGILVLDGRPPSPPMRPANPAAGAGPVERDPTAVALFTASWHHLTLTDRGLAYLAARGLPYRETALAAALRSLDGVAGLRQLYRALRGHCSEDALRRYITRPRWLPFGDAPALLIGYEYGGEVETFRVRNMDPEASHDRRYRDLAGHPPRLPWHADALTDLTGHELHIAEGELNAFALWGCASRLRVIGLPGAGRIPGGADAPWLQQVGAARQVVLWFDRDRAGDQGAQRMAETLRALHPQLPIVRGDLGVSGDLADAQQRAELAQLVAPLREAA